MKAALAVGTSIALLALDVVEAKAAWVSTNGPLGTHAQALTLLPARGFAATPAGLFSTDDYASWNFNSALGGFNVSCVATSASVPNSLIVGTLGSGIFRSLDGGTSWLAASSGLPNSTVRSMAAVEDPYTGTAYFAGTDEGVFRAHSGGSVWAARGLDAYSVQALAFYYEGDNDEDGLGAHDLLAGTNGGGVLLYWHDGMGWLPKNKNLPNLFVTALAASSTFTVTFAGTAGDGVFRSDSVYAGWTPINAGLTDGNVTALATAGTRVFVGTAGSGVFSATDDGDGGFSPINAGLPDLFINALATDGTFVFAATGAGVFKRSLSEL